jgi:hypothetical protein
MISNGAAMLRTARIVLAVTALAATGTSQYAYDDGLPNASFTVGPAPVTLIWVQYFEPFGSSDTLTEILVMNGTTQGDPGVQVGSVGGVGLWDDPNDDRDPRDCVLLNWAPWTVQSSGQGVFEPVPIPPTLVASGFFIGAWATIDPAFPYEKPAAVDSSAPSLGRAWFASKSPASFSPSTVLAGAWPLIVDAVWCLRANGSSGSSFFCTAKSSLACGVPAIAFTGISSATATSGFIVSATPARTCKQGLLVYNTTQLPMGVPFQGGTLCVTPGQARRAGPTDSGGSPGGTNCDGNFAIDMSSFTQGLWQVPDCAGNPSGLASTTPAAFLITPGQDVYCQYWGRDSVATGSFVSDGLHYVIGP